MTAPASKRANAKARFPRSCLINYSAKFPGKNTETLLAESGLIENARNNLPSARSPPN